MQAGDVFAATIATKPPLVKRALNSFTHNFAAAQIRAEVRATRIEHGESSHFSSKGYEIPSEDSFAERAAPQVVRVTEQVPVGRMRRETCHRWRYWHFNTAAQPLFISERAHRKSLLRSIAPVSVVDQ